MCGICGEFNYEGDRQEIESRISGMLSLMGHRGPDGEGSYVDDRVALGHRRLSIIDLSSEASQPMTSPSGRYVLVFNGEIYNFPELRQELSSRGESFRTRSDSEVLLRAFETWGLDFLQKLNGMWAFAIWDKQKRRLILARDRVGKKPLYFAHTRKGLIFSSEIHPLFLEKSVKKDIDRKALAEQVACRYVLAPRTLFRSVKKLPPGHVMVVSEGGTRLSQYYRVPLGGPIRNISEDQAREEFSTLLRRSVERRLISDVPLGVLLSGGLDSTAIVAEMSALGHREVATFTVGFAEGTGYDEREYALEVARHYGTKHSDFLISAEGFIEGLDGVLRHQDDPVADLALLPLYYLCREAKPSVKVLLSGQGADEVVGGYHLDRVLRQIKAITLLRKFPGSGLLARAWGRMDGKRSYLAKWRYLKDASAGVLPGRIRYDLTMPLGRDKMDRLFLDPPEPPYDRTLDAFYSEVPSHRGPIDAILGTLIKGWLPDNLLNHGDRMSMANSIEMRCPFLDVELIEFCFSLPEDLKVTTGGTKKVLRNWALASGVPRSIVERRKKGFPIPWDIWLRGPLYSTVRDRVLSTGWFADHFDMGAVDGLFREHAEGKDNGITIWNFLILSHWGKIMEI